MPTYTIADPRADRPLNLLSMVSAMTEIQSRHLPPIVKVEITKDEAEALKRQIEHAAFMQAIPGTLPSTIMGVPLVVKD